MNSSPVQFSLCNAPARPSIGPSGEAIQARIQRLTEIGIALSAELNLDALLEKIVSYARELTHADGGTLYLVQNDELHGRIGAPRKR